MAENWKQMLRQPRWITFTILVLLVIAAFIRLGFWQLDRLKQRRANNAIAIAHQNAPLLDINTAGQPGNPVDWQYRMATATGTYDYAHQVGVGSEARDGQLGMYMVTPLLLQGSQQAILVNRGWVPMTSFNPADWAVYNQPGIVTVKGMLMLADGSDQLQKAVFSKPSQPVEHLASVRLDILSRQTPETLLPVYLQAAPAGPPGSLPAAALPVIDLSDGPHLNYAAQWFSFAAIFAIGYPFFIRRSLHKTRLESDIK